LDYSVLWEEHNHYFTPASLQLTLHNLGWSTVSLEQIESGGEQILVALTKPADKGLSPVTKSNLEKEIGQATIFGSKFSGVRTRTRQRLNEERSRRSQLILFGANHGASTFLDLFGHQGLFDVCIDHSVGKAGRYISRWGVPIRGPHTMPIEDDALIVSAIHPGRTEEAEEVLLCHIGKPVSIARVTDLVTE
ncbi:hypothetical protein N9B81_00995, partial [bacterium]|nr:hypothetical protein [bacterium]